MSGAEGSEQRFAVDVMLGKLAKWLRVLGFDARVANLSNPGIVASCISDGMVPVTRRKAYRESDGVLFIESDNHFEQLKEFFAKAGIGGEDFRLFSRCTVCNTKLSEISREAAFGAVPDFVFETASNFRRCPDCGRIYWPGSHKGRMLQKLASTMGRDPHQEEGTNGSR